MPRKTKKTISARLAGDHAILLDGVRLLLEAEAI
jgi:hypothetical protein